MLALTSDVATKRMKEINDTPISIVKTGDIFLAPLRSYGHGWYDHLPLPGKFDILYLVEFIYGDLIGKKSNKIEVFCSTFGDRFTLDHMSIKLYGSTYNHLNIPRDAVILKPDDISTYSYVFTNPTTITKKTKSKNNKQK